MVKSNPRALSAIAFLAAIWGFLDCGSTSYAIRGDVKPAPVDNEVAALPGVRAFWFPSREYGGKIYVLVAGQDARSRKSPTLLLVHGLGDAGVRDFYPLLPELARTRRIVAFDLPGFGRSDKANLKYAPDRFARVVSEIIEAFADGPVDVLGHSMGGAISLLHAAIYPAQVRRLILVDAAGILHREAWVAQHVRRVTDPTGRVLPRVAIAMADAAAMVVDTSRLFGAAPEMILEVGFLRQKILRAEPGRIAALSLILYDFGPAMARVTAPTLVVWGAEDVVAPLRTGQLLADRLRDARLVVIPGAGHVVMQDAPATLLAEIERHLSRVAAPGAPTMLATAAAGAVAIPAGGPLSPEASAVCRGAANMVFRGTYDHIVIEDCANARLEGVHARGLLIRRSSVSVVRSTFTGKIAADASTLVMTGGSVASNHGDGDRAAVEANDSQLDLAGVSIKTSGEICHMSGQTRIVFSVCPVQTPDGLAYRHGFETTAVAPKI